MSTTINTAPDVTQPLAEWLSWLEAVHPVAIDMGLERVAAVADRLGLKPAHSPLILVGGTNGKGSTVALLSAVYKHAGLKVGAYTSPHIEHFCERIKIDNQMVEESLVVEALAFIEKGRMPESLTYFEYTTLAAMHVFNVMQCDVVLFEVGLGGRLDATNLWDADCSIVTSVGLDHEEYLGSDISVIATEKAAIGRAGKPFISGVVDPPESLHQFARQHAFTLIDVGAMSVEQWPVTNLKGAHQRRNAACAVEAVHALQSVLPVAEEIIEHALLDVSITGRFECIDIDGTTVVLDVAHNPAGAEVLVDTWQSLFAELPCSIVFATMSDKDIGGIIRTLNPIVQTWHCLALDVSRAASSSELHATIEKSVPCAEVYEHDNAVDAFTAALSSARAADGAVLIAGSFYTIGAISALAYGALPDSTSFGKDQ